MQARALARAAAIWALRFYRAHFWVVFGLSVIPAIQRPIVILRGDEISSFAIGVGEAVTGLARALLFWFSIRIGIGADPMFTTTNRWDLFGLASAA